MSKSKVCITGANGRVGRELVAHLAQAGYPVTGLVRSEGAARTVEEAGGTAVIAELSDTRALASAPSYTGHSTPGQSAGEATTSCASGQAQG